MTKVGGISEERRIWWMAQDLGVRFIPHGWNTAVGLAADLQFACAFSGTDLVEYLTWSPFIDAITAGGWHLDADAMLAIPATPTLPGTGHPRRGQVHRRRLQTAGVIGSRAGLKNS